MKDAFLTLAAPAEGEFKDRGSKFLAYAFPVIDEGEIAARFDEVRKLHPKARHHCYAWRLGLDANRFRANDDGEPSGTAGRPILGQIDSAGLTNVAVVVVRYFGGTLLGTSGLIQAYRESAADALRQATVEEKVIEDIVELRFDYALMSDVMNALKRLDLQVSSQEFTDLGVMKVGVRQRETAHTLLMLKSYIAKVTPDHAAVLSEIVGLEIEIVGTTA